MDKVKRTIFNREQLAQRLGELPYAIRFTDEDKQLQNIARAGDFDRVIRELSLEHDTHVEAGNMIKAEVIDEASVQTQMLMDALKEQRHVCPRCGSDDVATWAEDGESDTADHAECGDRKGCGWAGPAESLESGRQDGGPIPQDTLSPAFHHRVIFALEALTYVPSYEFPGYVSMPVGKDDAYEGLVVNTGQHGWDYGTMEYEGQPVESLSPVEVELEPDDQTGQLTPHRIASAWKIKLDELAKSDAVRQIVAPRLEQSARMTDEQAAEVGRVAKWWTETEEDGGPDPELGLSSFTATALRPDHKVPTDHLTDEEFKAYETAILIVSEFVNGEGQMGAFRTVVAMDGRILLNDEVM
jgi:hypothetical protein